MKYYLLGVLILLIASLSSYACELKVRYERYSAFSTTSNLARWHGLDVDYARALLDLADCQYNFVELPWGRAIDGLKVGLVDLVLSVSKTADRAPFYYFLGPQRNETIVLAMNNDNVYPINNINDLLKLPLPIAIHRGAYYGENFAKIIKQNPEHFITVVENQTKLNLLAHNKISGFLEEKGNLVYQKHVNPSFADIYIDNFIINSEPVYYAFSKRSLSKAQFDKIKQVFESDDYQNMQRAILAKYGLE